MRFKRKFTPLSMAEIEGVEMGGERGDTVICMDAMSTDMFEEETEIEGSDGERDAAIEIDATSTKISKDETAETATHDDKLPASVQKKLDAVPGEPLVFRAVTIFRVPAWFHQADKMYYEPKMVSLGPYHHGKKKLRAMEEYKWSMLRDFLSRNNKVNFNTYLREIRTLATQAYMCYSEGVSMTSDKFVMMLTLDGCFILELFLKLKHQNCDPILFSSSWTSSGLSTDILLMENQIPFFIIHKLFAVHGGCAKYCEGPCPLLKLIYRYLVKNLIQTQMLGIPKKTSVSVQHLLHFSHLCMVPKLEIKEYNLQVDDQSCQRASGNFSRLKSWFLSQLTGRAEEEEEEEEEPERVEMSSQPMDSIPCVSELCGAGVKFKRNRKARHIFDISFENGIMEMPLIKIDSIQKIILTNLAAFEQSQQLDFSQTFASYLGLMDALVNTERDVALLQDCGIVDNFLQNEEDAAKFFNHFGDFKTVYRDEHSFKDLFIKVRKYNDSTWHKYRAKLMNDYFNNPWAIISVVAGGVLLTLTIVQTIYTVYSSYHILI